MLSIYKRITKNLDDLTFLTFNYKIKHINTYCLVLQAGFECMQKFLSGFQIDMEMVHPVMRPLLLTLGDHRNLSVNGAKRLSYLTQLFPSTFSEKLCEQLLQLLKKLLDYSIQTNRGKCK